MDFCQMLHDYAKKDLTAHVYRESKMTYRELEDKSNALAAYIVDNYKSDKTPIIVYGHKEHEMLIAFYACMKSGHPYIPVDTVTPLERVKDIVEISGTEVLLSVGSRLLDISSVRNLSSLEIKDIFFDYRGQLPDEKYRVQGEDIHYIIYTSGSTGKPKGVKITSNCITSFVKWATGFWNLFDSSHYTFLNQAPFSFDLSVMDLYLSLFSGSTLYSIDKEMISNLKQLFNYLKASCVDIWVSTPSFAEMCLGDSSFDSELLPNLKLMLFCGETLTNNCVRRLHDRFENLKVINLYGPTEATVAVTAVKVDSKLCEEKNPLPVGYVKEDCKIIIVKEAEEHNSIDKECLTFGERKYHVLPQGERGEIVICGESVSPGYLNNQEASRKVFLDKQDGDLNLRYYRTGDEGYLDEGLLYYCGRIDFQLKLNGFRIELGDIESNLMSIDFIDGAAVVPVMKDGKPYYLAAAVTLNRRFAEKDFALGIMIKDKLKGLLPDYMIPRKIIIKESLPMTSNGKVNRKLLMEELK